MRMLREGGIVESLCFLENENRKQKAKSKKHHQTDLSFLKPGLMGDDPSNKDDSKLL